MSTGIFNWTARMGPCLEWEGSQESPVCTGSCARGWTRDPKTNLWLCAKCLKPTHAYLRECDSCEQIYLPSPEALEKAEANEKFRYTLDHEDC